MVSHERHIAHNQGVFSAADDGFGMVNHDIHGYRQGIFIAQDYHPQTITDQNDGNITAIDNFCGGVIVSGEHGNFLAVLFHIADVIDGNAFD